jgi:hypothetical protein
MLFPTKRVLIEYKSLLVKMNDDLGMIRTTRPTFASCPCWRLSMT